MDIIYGIDFTKTTEDGLKGKSGLYLVTNSNGKYYIYVGESEDIKERFVGHEKRACWQRHSYSKGDPVYVYYCDKATREREEKRLIDKIKPPCNVQGA